MSIRLRDALTRELGALRYEPIDKRIRDALVAPVAPQHGGGFCALSLRTRLVRSHERRDRGCVLAGRTYEGSGIQGEVPDWKPLVDLIGEELVCDFMWMYGVELSTGARLHAYKHIDTRRYIHLAAADGAAWAYVPRGRYRRIAAADVLDEVFADLPGLYRVTDAQIARSLAAAERVREREARAPPCA